MISALSLGDEEFLFRILAARLQNSGDVFAGFVALKNYDYSRVYDWMMMLDGLNNKSNLVPALASYYYSQTQNKKDNYWIVKYLQQHSVADLNNNWWWLMQATFIAKNDLKDMDLAIDLADKLADSEIAAAPFWIKSLSGVLRETKGDNCAIFKAIENLVQNLNKKEDTISMAEIEMQRYFIRTHLEKLKAEKFDPKKCYKKS